MQYRPLGQTDLKVSLIGLGTMTWGEQNTEADAHAQLDMAVDHGINLIDTKWNDVIYPLNVSL
ncbi:aldo/keto reductase [Oceanisphaera sp. IT1-181]|uniref:aldo/keto reductase n=1 Tax=Oceanisphaera sp. IT1-181 TaxID=3081199 RepID=UPI0029C9E8C3|nr:aldo/keto reductase [Oceanisphaera sp. IT1-181]